MGRMDGESPNINGSEARELIRRKYNRVVNGTLPELLEILDKGFVGEKTPTEKTRKKLEMYVLPLWEQLQTNFPCAAQKKSGHCTVFGCSDAVHLNCLLGAQELMEDASRNSK